MPSSRMLRCDGGPALSVVTDIASALARLFKRRRDYQSGSNLAGCPNPRAEFLRAPEDAKRLDGNAVRRTGGRRFRVLAAFCQGFADGIGSPMFELKRYAWKRGYRCGATRLGSAIEGPLIRERSQAIGSVPFQFRHNGNRGRRWC